MYGDTNTCSAALGDLSRAQANAIEVRPLENIGKMADNLGRMNAALDAYLERFNGPRPCDAAESKSVPFPGYRSDLDRLDRAIRETGDLVDLLGRLG